jgi:hypothetical protein
MKKFAVAVLLVLVAGALCLAPSAFAQDKKDHAFIGADGCKMCHMSKAKGDQFGQWKASPHANAFTVLGTPEAKAVAEKAGVTGNPQEAAQCLSCHVTAHGVKAELVGAKFKKEDGVSCESCHGAGADYKDINVMKDKAKAVAAGMNVPDEKTCKGCHNEKSPTFKGFEYAKALPKIAHPYPKATP